MLDAQLQTVIQATLIDGLDVRGVMGVRVIQNNQPRQFSAPSSAALFHTIAPRKPYGWPQYKDTFNMGSVPPTFSRTKTQVMHSRFQIAGCQLEPSPANPTLYSSGDLAAMAASILTDEDNIALYVAAGFNVLRVTELPAFWFSDSKGQNVLWSPFDIIFTHKDVYTTTIGAITEFDSGIYRV